MKSNLIKFLATGGGVGYVPLIPGTVGSLWGVVLYYLLHANFPLLLIVTVVFCVISIPVSTLAEDAFGKKDCQCIVIDEIAGQLLTYVFFSYTQTNLILGFIFFRLFDMGKVFPASYAQKHWPKGWGVAGDDLIAGVQAALLLWLVNSLF